MTTPKRNSLEVMCSLFWIFPNIFYSIKFIIPCRFNLIARACVRTYLRPLVVAVRAAVRISVRELLWELLLERLVLGLLWGILWEFLGSPEPDLWSSMRFWKLREHREAILSDRPGKHFVRAFCWATLQASFRLQTLEASKAFALKTHFLSSLPATSQFDRF